jgi:hypothetical protein
MVLDHHERARGGASRLWRIWPELHQGVGEKKVDFNGTVSSLTAATRKVLGLPDDYPLQPSPHWTFNGKTVKEIYEEFHDSTDES